MVVLSLQVPVGEVEMLVAELWEAGIEGIREGDETDGLVRLDVFLASPQIADALAASHASLNPEIAPADERDWVVYSRQMWQPIEAGDRFYLVPEWDSSGEAPTGRIVLKMPAGQGFGSGFHESTRLALSALENTPVEGKSVLDVGTGSGILLAAARQLGAAHLAGCDLDPVAIESATQYLAASDVLASFYLGSIDAVRPARFHLVLANLNATLILNLMDELLAALQPHGRLILSGILAEEAPVIHRALEAANGVTRIYHAALGDWVNFRVTTGTGA